MHNPKLGPLLEYHLTHMHTYNQQWNNPIEPIKTLFHIKLH